MTDTRQQERKAQREAQRMQRLRDRWWRTAVEGQLVDLLRQSLAEIRQTDPTFEARMLAGWGATVSIHAVNPERMEELVKETPAIQAPKILGADGSPLH